MISAISAQGALRFSILTGTLTAAGFIAFLKRLMHDAEHTGGDPVFCIVDNHPAHRAKAVDRFVDSTDGALRLYRLPAYSPQLNRTSGCGRTSSTTESPPPLPTARTR
jgi:hypothetical protein